MSKKRKKNSTLPAAVAFSDEVVDPKTLLDRRRYGEVFVFFVLLALGIYQSVIYFDHKVVPNFDFPAFYRTGQALWSLELPSDFKRAPVLGFMQVGLSHLVGGHTPGLTAGRIINAIFHPLLLLLFWLVGRQLVGTAAAWIAILAAINPWVVWLIPEPIAQPPMLFFILAGFYFAFQHSRWAYLFAALASMTRYDGAALIPALLVFDLIYHKTAKARWMTLLWTVAASLPLFIWMLLTALNWEGRGEMHYLNVLTGTKAGFWSAVFADLQRLWDVAFAPLIYSPQKATPASKTVMVALQIAMVLSFLFALVWAIIKRNWKIIALFIFLLPYFVVHVFHSFNYHKFYAVIHWIALLVCAYGGYNLWFLLKEKVHLPKWSIAIFEILVLLAAAIGLISLIQILPKLAPYSVNSTTLPAICLIALSLIYVGRLIVYKTQFALRDLAATFLVAVMIFSNQFTLVRIIGNGQTDIEFKLLADWYNQQALPDEKLVTSMPHIVRIFSPEHSRNFKHPRNIEADNFKQFTQTCLKKNIAYVAWDSRLGHYPNDRYYQLYKLKNIAPLARPQNIGPYHYLKTVGSRRRFINIFRLRQHPETNKKN